MSVKQTINDMLQSINATSLPNKLNSVRSIPVPAQKIDKYDLLNLYLDNHYQGINQFLRANNYNEGYNKLVDDTRNKFFSANKKRVGVDYINYDNPESVANQIISYLPDLESSIKSYPKYIANSKVEKYPGENFRYGGLNTDYELYRGISFNSPEERNGFVNQFQDNQIVDLPAFTSTSQSPYISNMFQKYHAPQNNAVNFEIYPNSNNEINSYYVRTDNNDSLGGEWIMPPMSRAKVMFVDNSNDIPTVALQDATGELTPIEYRTQNILNRLKFRG